jgi:hypothetical protein
MPALGKKVPIISRFIKKLRGGSQPFLAEATDGRLYVVKLADNVQGPNLAFNEIMGSELYRLGALKVPQWKALILTTSFIDRNPGCWFEMEEGRRRPAPGLCYGSDYLWQQSTDILDVLPAPYFQRIANANDFWRAWILDVCASHCDNRQALFLPEPSGTLRCYFVDFGHMFGGPCGQRQEVPHRVSQYWDWRIYPHLNRRLLMTLRRMVDKIDKDELWHQVALVPDDWRNRSSVLNFMDSLDRLSNADFVEAALEGMANCHQKDVQKQIGTDRKSEGRVSVLRPGLPGVPGDRTALAC